MLRTDKADKRCDALPVRIPHMAAARRSLRFCRDRSPHSAIGLLVRQPQCIHSEPQLQPSWAIKWVRYFRGKPRVRR
jgi:hypothetical protein